MKKILLLAEKIDPNTTSAGLGTFKLMQSFIAVGYNVTCFYSDLNTQDSKFNPSSSFLRLKNKPVSFMNFLHALMNRLKLIGVKGFWEKKFGFSPKFFHEVNMCARQIQSVLNNNHFDLIFVRAAGASFRLHAAMLKVNTQTPWVAYFHDPFPFSQYPEPYREIIPGKSKKQEQLGKKIINQADYVAAPSEQIVKWAKSFATSKTNKFFQLPHPGYTVQYEQESKLPFKKTDFVLLHAGQLLGARNPRFLLEAFVALCKENKEFAQKAKLIFVGWVVSKKVMKIYDNQSNIIWINQRVPYGTCLSWIRSATVPILLEAISNESPFFAGKLADYVWLEKNPLMLTPKKSTANELLGKTYPYSVETDDAEGIKKCIWAMYLQWTQGEFQVCTEINALKNYISPVSLQNILEKNVFNN